MTSMASHFPDCMASSSMASYYGLKHDVIQWHFLANTSSRDAKYGFPFTDSMASSSRASHYSHKQHVIQWHSFQTLPHVMPSLALNFRTLWFLQIGQVITATNNTSSNGISLQTLPHVMPSMASHFRTLWLLQVGQGFAATNIT